MVKALQNWLDTHELPAIIAGVLGVIVLLSLVLVVGGYWLVTPQTLSLNQSSATRPRRENTARQSPSA